MRHPLLHLALRRHGVLIARAAWTGRPLRLGVGADVDLRLNAGCAEGIVAIVDRTADGHMELIDLSGGGLLLGGDRASHRVVMEVGSSVALGEGLSLTWNDEAALAGDRQSLEACVRDLPRVPDRADGREVIEVSRWWHGARVDVQHVPLDAPVTLGEDMVACWSMLGMPLGDVPDHLAPLLRMSPPLVSEVDSAPRHDLTLPVEALPGGRPWTLVVPTDAGPEVRVPSGWLCHAPTGRLLGPHQTVAVDVGHAVLVVRRRPAVDGVLPVPWHVERPLARALAVSAAWVAGLMVVALNAPPVPIASIGGETAPVSRTRFMRPPAPPAEPVGQAAAKTSGAASGEAGRAGPPAQGPTPDGGARLPDALSAAFGRMDRLLGDGLGAQVENLGALSRRGLSSALDLGGSGLSTLGDRAGGGGDAIARVGLGPVGSGTGAGDGGEETWAKPASAGPDPASEPLLIGTLTREEVDRVIRKNLRGFRYCYQK